MSPDHYKQQTTTFNTFFMYQFNDFKEIHVHEKNMGLNVKHEFRQTNGFRIDKIA